MKKITKIKAAILVLLCGIMVVPASAQMEPNTSVLRRKSDYSPIDFNVTVKNMHLWRGLEVTPDAMTAVDLYFKDRSGQFQVGVWGGAAFSGDFKEFDYYVSYSYKGFNISVWDIYNFSPYATWNSSDIFNYKARETGHFVNVALSYRFQKNFPLELGWSTIFLGRDRGENNEKNLYSTYVWADYPIVRRWAVDLDFGIAGAFALSPEKGRGLNRRNFYGKDPGIVSITLTASKDIKLGSYTLPVSLMPMWNPVNNNANIQLALRLF